MVGKALEDEGSRVGCPSSDAVAPGDSDCAPNGFAQFACGGHCCWIVAQHKLPSGANFVLAGNVHIDGQTYTVLYDKAKPPEERVRTGANLAEVLTRRELQIVTLVASGRVNKQIAHLLTISEYTVSTHLRRIFCKLGVSSRAAMVAHVVSQLHLEADHVHPALRAE